MKTKFTYLSVLALSLASVSAFAALLQGEPSGKSIENQPILKSASIKAVDARGGDIQVTSVGAALRQKNKMGVNFKVYVGQLLASEPAKVNHAGDKVLDSLTGMRAVAMQMTFLRPVTGGDLITSFTDSFTSNGANLTAGIAKQVLDSVAASGDVEAGKSITFVGELGADGKEHITMENSKGEIKTISGDAGSIRTVFALWLGTLPAKDAGLLKFKADLLAQ